MRTEHGPKNGPKADQQGWKPPRGIRYLPQRPNRPKPFLLEWREPGQTEPRYQSFKTEKDREDFAKDLAEKREEHGRTMLSFDPREWGRWLKFREIVGTDVDPLIVAHEWREMRQGTAGGAAGLTVTTAVDRYLKRRFDGKLSADTRRHLKKHLKDRFAAKYGALQLREINPEHITTWLKELRHPRTGEPMDNLTKRHHRKDLNTFLDHAVADEWIRRNPCALVWATTN